MRELLQRRRTRIMVITGGFVFAVLASWFIGQQFNDATIVPPGVEYLYPGVWPQVPRGILWLTVGAAAVVFDLALATNPLLSRAGRRGVYAFGAFTGLLFVAFAIGTFAGADWSIIH